MSGRRMMNKRKSNNLFRRTANRTAVTNLASKRQGMRGGFHF